MPIYEYECTACGHFLEKLQKVGEPPLLDCPECHAATLQKLISAAGFRLKGGGWYETDFKTGNKKNVSATGEASKPASGTADKKPTSSEKKSSSE
jgi:putative FmdB family regulatory protein